MKNFETVKAAVIDDDLNYHGIIADILSQQFKNMKLYFAKNVSSGEILIRETVPDIVFLDIDMPDGTGFDLLNRFDNHNFKLIFITAYEEHALKAIKYSAIDYILKPVDPAELIRSVHKAIADMANDFESIKIQTFLQNIEQFSSKPKKIVLNTADQIYVVNIEDIVMCQSDDNYTIFYIKNQTKITMSKTLKEFETLLDESLFLRVHRSFLVNINHIERYDKKNTGFLFLSAGLKAPVSTGKKEHLVDILKKMK